MSILIDEHESDDDATETLTTVLGALQARGAVSVLIEYDGESDEGYINEVTAKNAEDVAIKVEQNEREVLELWAEEMLPPGWEINEGAYGEITLDLVERKWSQVHNERVISVDTTEEDGTLPEVVYNGDDPNGK